MQAYLKTTTLYTNLFEEVWLWMEFPYHDQLRGNDTGIDLVARTIDGEYWAIQCKYYVADAVITKPEVDSFLSTSSKFFETDTGTTGFVHRLWISTTNKWNSTVEQTIRNLNPPVTRLNLIDLENDEVDWNSLEQGIFGKASRSKPLVIKEHQQVAIDQTHTYFQLNPDTGCRAHSRGKLWPAVQVKPSPRYELPRTKPEAGDWYCFWYHRLPCWARHYVPGCSRLRNP